MLFSIITPVYNNTKYLKTAVNSVLSQTCSDFEYIIVDDGSTDGTAELVDELAATDSRIRVIHQKNQWIYASINNAVAIAKGEYFLVVNSDDKLCEESVSCAAELIQKYNHPDVLLGRIIVNECDKDQNVLRSDIEQQHAKNLQEEYFPDCKSVRNNWSRVFRYGLMDNQVNFYKTKFGRMYPFRNDYYGADAIFNLEIADSICSLAVLKKPIYEFNKYIVEGSASVGKCYGYEHEMFNLLYSKHLKLLDLWGKRDDEMSTFLARRRLSAVSHEMRVLGYKGCNLSIDEKLEYIFKSIVDSVVANCVEMLDAREELEARILSGIRALLLKDSISSESKYYYAYEMLVILTRYENDEADYAYLRQCIESSTNPHHIGQTFYDKLVVSL